MGSKESCRASEKQIEFLLKYKPYSLPKKMKIKQMQERKQNLQKVERLWNGGRVFEGNGGEEREKLSRWYEEEEEGKFNIAPAQLSSEIKNWVATTFSSSLISVGFKSPHWGSSSPLVEQASMKSSLSLIHDRSPFSCGNMKPETRRVWPGTPSSSPAKSVHLSTIGIHSQSLLLFDTIFQTSSMGASTMPPTDPCHFLFSISFL
nr:hypothetical protein Iba_chr05fCG13020 [Ipomoea batatas]